jgi:hypothetical protein
VHATHLIEHVRHVLGRHLVRPGSRGAPRPKALHAVNPSQTQRKGNAACPRARGRRARLRYLLPARHLLGARHGGYLLVQIARQPLGHRRRRRRPSPSPAVVGIHSRRR